MGSEIQREKRGKELEKQKEAKQFVKKMKKKRKVPLYLKMQQRFHQKEIKKIINTEKKLKKRKQQYKATNWDEINFHERKYDETKPPSHKKFLPDINQPRTRNKLSKGNQIEDILDKKRSIKKERERTEVLIKRRKEYGKIVRKYFKPKSNAKLEQELQDRIQKIHHPVKMPHPENLTREYDNYLIHSGRRSHRSKRRRRVSPEQENYHQQRIIKNNISPNHNHYEKNQMSSRTTPKLPNINHQRNNREVFSEPMNSRRRKTKYTRNNLDRESSNIRNNIRRYEQKLE